MIELPHLFQEVPAPRLHNDLMTPEEDAPAPRRQNLNRSRRAQDSAVPRSSGSKSALELAVSQDSQVIYPSVLFCVYRLSLLLRTQKIE